MQSSRFSTPRSTLSRVQYALATLVVALVGMVAVYASFTYAKNGYRQCRHEGSSVTWCLASLQWQSFKASFLSDKETVAKPGH